MTVWWSEFTLQTKLMAVATLVVSLIVSGFTFWAVDTIQQDAHLNDTRYGRDLGLLLAANVTPMVAQNNRSEVARFSRQFYNSTSSVRYLIYADEEGNIFFGLPFSEPEVKNSLTLRRRIQLPENFEANAELPFIRQHLTPNGEVTDVFVPLVDGEKSLGVMAIGINPNPTVVISSNLTRDVTIAVFVSIWVMAIIGSVLNALTITQPIKELVVGVTNIATGNFKQRIDLPWGGELGELIFSFNEMAEKLEKYEEQNIEELTAEKAKLDTLVSTIADGALLLDADLQIILVNPTAHKIFGWDNKSVIGTHVLEQLPLSVKQALEEPLSQIIKGEAIDHHLPEGDEFRCSLKEPTKRTVRILLNTVLLNKISASESLCKSCIYDAGNVCLANQNNVTNDCSSYVESQYRPNLKGIALTIQDITREVELNEAKSQFISNISHELRTPLFNIKSFIETLYEFGDDLGEDQRKEFLATANHETDRLTRLVNDVLDLSRLESAKTYHFDPVDITQLIEQTIRTYQLNARDKKIELSHEVEAHLPPVLGNYDLLLQVFDNLVGNAMKFTPSGGRVVMRAYVLENCALETSFKDHSNAHYVYQNKLVRIEISDTGIGIDPEDQEAIFDRFFRVENRVHTLEGTGLGLSIVRNIIDKHHTKINLVSEVGIGTTFWFDLPVVKLERS